MGDSCQETRLIDDLRLEFGKGLTVENGETEFVGVSGATHE